MATEVKRRRGTTAQHLLFTGAEAEITVDTDKYTLLVHDDSGSAPTGHELLRADFSNIPTSITSNITMNGILTIDRSSASSGFALNILGSSQDNIRFLHDGRTIESTGVLNIDAGDADDENLNLNAAHIYINNNADVDGNLNITGEATASEFIGDLRGAVRFQVQADVAIAKGDAVYISGVSGTKPTVGLADADDATKMPAFGLAAGAISANASGEVITFGTLSVIDTSSFTVGDVLYISTNGTTGNTLTATAPAGESAQIQNIGKVQRSHASAGSIKVGGAGRSNATPNLNQDKIFLGDSNNRAVSTALSSIGLSSFNNDAGFVTSTGDNTFVTSASFNTGDGVLTLTRNDTNTVTVDLDSRYLELGGGTITGDLIVKSTDAGSAADPNVTFFRDSASPADNDVLGDLLFSGRNDAATQVTYGRIASQIADASSTTHDGKLRFQVASDAALVTPLTIEGTASTFTTSLTATSFVKTANSGGFLKADGTEDTNTYLTSETSHADVLVDGDFTSNGLMKRTGAGTYGIVTDNSSNWDTAYNWGDHSTAGYLTSYSETDTLSDVTGRGASTTDTVSFDKSSASSGNALRVLGAAGNIDFSYLGTQISFSAQSTITAGTNDLYLAGSQVVVDTNLYNDGDATVTGSITAGSIVKDGGSSSQFLKADGSVDSNTYLTAVPSEYLTQTEGDARYLQLTGGTISSNLIISGNLTVSGTTTTINTETINLADNIILLNSNYDGETPTESAGIEIERGPSNTNKQFLWNETNDRWQTDDALYVSGALTATGNVTGSSIIKSGGTSSQFLKADGSVDSSTYLTSFDITTQTDPKYLRSDVEDQGHMINLGGEISAGSGAKLQVYGFQRTGPIMIAVGNTSSTSWGVTNELWLMNSSGNLYVGDGTNYTNRVFHDGYHPNADKLTTARTINLTGAVTGSVSFDGSSTVSMATTATSDPTLTLAGDATGSATFTNLGNATLTVTVVDDSHNHIIGNVDGLQTALDGKLSLTGGTVTNSIKLTGGSLIHEHNSDGGYIAHPDGAFYQTTTSTHTGAIKITLPVDADTTQQDMVKFVVDVYDYTTNESFSVQVAGYVYSSTNEWLNCSATILADNTNRDFNVRFGKDIDNKCIWIGETTSTWAYPQIVVRDFYGGYRTDIDEYASGWNISFVTIFDTVDETQSSNFPVARTAQQLQTGRTITLGGDLTGSASFDGSADITISAEVTNNSHTHDDRYLQLSGGALTGATSITTSTNRVLTLDYTGAGSYTLMSFKQSGTEQFRLWGSDTDNYLSFYNDQSNGHQLTLASNGNVGIGTTNPDEIFHINRARSAGSDNFLLELQNPTTVADSRAGILFSTNANTGTGRDGAAIQAANNGVDGKAHITFGSVLNQTYSENIRFESGGNVGIGNTAPAQKLVVNGGVHAYGNITTPASGTHGLLMDFYIADSRFWSRGTTGGGTRGGFEFYQLQADGTNQIKSFDLDTSGNATFAYDLDVGGELTVTKAGSQISLAEFRSTSGYAYINIGGSSGNDSGIIFTENGNANTAANRRYMLGYDESADNFRIYQYYKRDGVTNVSQDRFVINGNGNVGIGTSPSEKLDVQGDVIFGDYLKMGSSSSYMGYIGFNRNTANGNIYNSSYGAYQIHNYQGELQLQVYNSAGTQQGIHRFSNNGNVSLFGNVLIGTTTAQSGTKLQVAGVLDVWSSTNTLLRFNHDGTRGIIETFTGGSYSNTAINPNGGNVGIGTASPSSLLHLESASSPTLRIIDTTNSVTALYGSQNANAFLGTFSNHFLNFFTNSVERMRIHSNGDIAFRTASQVENFHFDSSETRLGIGNPAPDYTLDLNSGGSTTTARVSGVTNSASQAILRMTGYSVAGTQADIGAINFTNAADTGDAIVSSITAQKEGTQATAAGELQFKTKPYNGSLSTRMTIQGDGNVGIGTQTILGSANRLHVKVDDSNTDFSLGTPWHLLIENDNTTTGSGAMLGLRADTADGGIALHYGGATNTGYMTFHVDAGGAADGERMRIDSSGNVLVGKTSADLDTVGAELRANGIVGGTVSGGNVLWLNRTTSDGNIAIFSKDGTTVGSIGTVASRLVIASSNTGVTFQESTRTIYPSNTSGAGQNNAISLGNTGTKFKDLYLGGNANIDGDLEVDGITDTTRLIRSHDRKSSGNADPTERYPIGHHTLGEEVFSIDPTWSQDELRTFFNSNNIEWLEDSDAPSGYAIKIDGTVNVGGQYNSGFPYIPVYDGDVFYMEYYIKTPNTNTGIARVYVGSNEYNQSFSSLGGNPGSFGYWVDSGATFSPNTPWQKRSGYIKNTGGSNVVGEFESGIKYWTPMALWNYQTGSQDIYISGWRVIRVRQDGDRYFSGNVGIGTGTSSPDGLLNLSHQTSTSSLSDDASGYALTFNFEGATNDYGRHIAIRDANGDAVSAIGGFDEGTGGATALYFATGNTTSIAERMRINSSGNVGIGTTSPVAKFEVSDGSSSITLQEYNNGAAIFFDGSNGDFVGADYFHIIADGVGYLGLGGYAGGATPLNINYQGRVGIGTTSPSYKLHVEGDIGVGANDAVTARYTTSEAYKGTFRWAGLQLGNNGSNRIVAGRTNAGGVLDFYTNNTNDASDYAVTPDGTHVMRMATDGNVGIGTTSPSNHGTNVTTLEVKGTGSTTAGILKATNGNGLSSGMLYATASETLVGSFTNHGLKFIVNNVGVASFDTAGDFAINNDLDVDGTIFANSRITFDYGGGHYFEAGTNSLSYKSSGGTAAMSITSGGNMSLNGTLNVDSTATVAEDADALLIVGTTRSSSYTGSDTKLELRGKNLQSGSQYYGDYGQLLFNSSTNYTGSARDFLLTNALETNKFAIIQGTTGNVAPTIGAAGALTNGTARFVIDSAGNTGIGTDSPISKLHVIDSQNIAANATGDGQLSVGGNGYTFAVALDAQAAHIYHNSSIRNIEIGTNEGTDLTIHSNGNVSIADGNLIVAAGHGVDFSANQNNSGMTSELLDDYEEGTFTPTIHAGASNIVLASNNYGKYTKIGNVVHCSGRFQASSLTAGSSSTNVELGGLPFAANTPLGTSTGAVAGSIGFAGGFAGEAATMMQIRDGETNAFLYYQNSSLTVSNVKGNDLGNTTTIVFQITYHTT